ncbi:DUF3710 domain-containing protein [Glutamicibacter halophytocola]|uniref:DUF3710 domain-containing protein n=1 Tax=Glutamicibacter halophytocola TaxID=1933880 RepID=UPI003D26B5DC
MATMEKSCWPKFHSSCQMAVPATSHCVSWELTDLAGSFVQSSAAMQLPMKKRPATVDGILRDVIVNRGDKPLPPAELLPLNVPANAQTRPVQEDAQPEIKRPERGPEITQIG